DAGAIPIVIGQNSPCGSYAIAKPIAARTKGLVGMVSLDTHWDSAALDRLTQDPRIAGSGSWKAKTYEFQPNFSVPHLVENAPRATWGGARGVFGDRGGVGQGDRIKAVGPSGERAALHASLPSVDARGKAILPGIVIAHTHVLLLALRGTVEDMSSEVIYGY